MLGISGTTDHGVRSTTADSTHAIMEFSSSGVASFKPGRGHLGIEQDPFQIDSSLNHQGEGKGRVKGKSRPVRLSTPEHKKNWLLDANLKNLTKSCSVSAARDH